MINPQPTPGDNEEKPLNDMSVEELQKQLLIEQIKSEQSKKQTEKAEIAERQKDRESRKSNRNIIIGVLVAIVIIAAIAIPVGISLHNHFERDQELQRGFDDVANMDPTSLL